MKNHFAHKPNTSDCALLNEGWLHLSAKYQILYQVMEWIEGRIESPVLVRKCEFCHEVKEQALPKKIQMIELEKEVDGCRVDVALYDGEGNLLCGIEVKDTHGVDEEKEKKLTIPWMEVEAKMVLEQPDKWNLIQEGNCKEFRCKCWTTVWKKGGSRGFAKHIDGCPKVARRWKGKAYANLIDDCFCCEHLVYHTQDFEYGSYIACSGFGINPDPRRKKLIREQNQN